MKPFFDLDFVLASVRSGDGFKCRSRSPFLKPLRVFGDKFSYQGCSQDKAW